ncbi:hypothetical protein FH609_010685 [Streptomyces sp. 3MP-14]|uniref:Uncharacterized protein n=1 Tax=Streptomyces mimosae TaxID=2586635 RepID=A0A5N6AGC1_9ACTN|nr:MULTISPECIES: hypothetical protein [Streptomyces]KAB8167701.1 hypothetical protein FH607_006735 [Streptomyces mimosae]KAB8177652.1 hypothetical protein FH609_010685 [Streptomyces sp. 3MP-14]
MSAVIRRTREELEAQRVRLLEEVHMSEEKLRERAAFHTLSPRELDVWHTIEDIDFLLSD